MSTTQQITRTVFDLPAFGIWLDVEWYFWDLLDTNTTWILMNQIDLYSLKLGSDLRHKHLHGLHLSLTLPYIKWKRVHSQGAPNPKMSGENPFHTLVILTWYDDVGDFVILYSLYKMENYIAQAPQAPRCQGRIHFIHLWYSHGIMCMKLVFQKSKHMNYVLYSTEQ